jgi:hypothetical protein
MAKKEKLKLKKVIGKEQNDTASMRVLKRGGDPGLISEKTANVFKKDSVK